MLNRNPPSLICRSLTFKGHFLLSMLHFSEMLRSHVTSSPSRRSIIEGFIFPLHTSPSHCADRRGRSYLPFTPRRRRRIPPPSRTLTGNLSPHFVTRPSVHGGPSPGGLALRPDRLFFHRLGRLERIVFPLVELNLRDIFLSGCCASPLFLWTATLLNFCSSSLFPPVRTVKYT